MEFAPPRAPTCSAMWKLSKAHPLGLLWVLYYIDISDEIISRCWPEAGGGAEGLPLPLRQLLPVAGPLLRLAWAASHASALQHERTAYLKEGKNVGRCMPGRGGSAQRPSMCFATSRCLSQSPARAPWGLRITGGALPDKTEN